MPPLEPPSFARSLLSSLLDRVKFFSRGGGLSASTSSSAPAALLYPETISPQDYINKYRRGGIAKSLVDLLPKAVWSGGFEVYDNEDPKITTPFESSFLTFSNRIKLTETLLLSHIACRANEFAVILIGDRISDFSSPLSNLISFDDITFLSVYWQNCISWDDVKDIEKDEKSERFGRPNIYTLTTATPKDIKAHHSRIIHVTNPDKCSDLTSLPCLEATWNDLENLTYIVGGGSLAAYNRADPGFHIALDPEYQWEEGEQEKYKGQWDKYFGKENGANGKVITTNGVKELTLLASNVHNFGSNAELVIDLLCGTSRTPRRELIGNARGQMGSETEQENWFNQIESEANRFAIPLVREVLDRILDFCPNEKKKISKQEDGTFNYQISFGKEKEANESELAKIVESLSRANVNQDKVRQPIIISSARLSEKLGEEPVKLVDDEEDVKDTTEEKTTITTTDEPSTQANKSINSRVVVASTNLVTSDQISEYEAVAQVADRFLDDFEENWIAYVDRLREKVGSISLRNKSVDALIFDVDDVITGLDSDLTTTYYDDILACMEDAGNAAAPYMVKLIESSPLEPSQITTLIQAPSTPFDYLNPAYNRISVQFDISNPRTIQWATTHAAELVTQLTNNTREGLREIISLAQTGEYTVQTLARDIKSHIGLRADQITAANNLANQLRSSEPGTVVRRFLPRPGVRDVAGFRAKIPSTGASESWIKQQLDRYNKLQLSNRAKTIARTEVNRSSVEGQKQLWLQSQENGILPKTVLRGWAVTRDEQLRDSHEEMSGKTTELDKPWIGGDGTSREPGMEINCRCGQYLVFVK